MYPVMNKNTKKILEQMEGEENPVPKTSTSVPLPTPKKDDFF